MARKGLYANIHAKRKRGGKMRKKGAKGAPTAANFRRAAQTARKRKWHVNTIECLEETNVTSGLLNQVQV